MKFTHLLTATFLISVFCATSQRANCEITPENCKPFVAPAFQEDVRIGYIDCNGAQQFFTNAPPEVGGTPPPTLFAQASSHIWISISKTDRHPDYEKSFPIGNGAIITCHHDGSFPPPGEIICESSPQNPDCKALNVIYEDAHFWATAEYQQCLDGGWVYPSVETGGSTFLVQPGTIIKIGPSGTFTNYKVLPIGDGLRMKCSGWEGTSGTCDDITLSPLH